MRSTWVFAALLVIAASTLGEWRGVAQPPAKPAPPPEAPPGVFTFTCPVDGAKTNWVQPGPGAGPSRNTDLEGPATPYQSYVVACEGCGYAMWADRFENRVDDTTKRLVRRVLYERRHEARQDGRVAYEHLARILAYQRAPLTDQLTANLFWSYVIKRKRPVGRVDLKLEAQLRDVRRTARNILQRAKADEPPATTRGMWEWTYLDGELARLVGEPDKAVSDLNAVCKYAAEAGPAIGKFACAQVERARRGDTSEFFRGELYDVRQIEIEEKDRLEREKQGKESAPEPPAQPSEPAPAPQ